MLAVLVLFGGCSKDEPKALKLTPAPQQLSKIYLQIKEIHIHVEVAETEEQRAKGLMFRDSLPEDQGMLFVYPADEKVRFYMLNVRFPLSVAFIGSDWQIQQIEDMQPREEMPVYSQHPIRYVLEMNEGWFERHGVGLGDRVQANLMKE
ncbi:MAG: DUF192 domain-containing protein [Planctomycetes bacterium]|nr:DUF192 domain-containing protein [Planctomycetota bacterium]